MTSDERDFFRKATIKICGTLDIEKACRNCLRYLGAFMPADRMSLHLYEPGLSAIRMVAVASQAKAVKLDHLVSVPSAARASAEWGQDENIRIFTSLEETLIAKEIFGKSSRLLGRSESAEFSVLVMRLEIEGQRRFGDVALFAKGPDRYRKEHARLFSWLNGPLAIAMSNFLRHREMIKLKDLLIDENQFLSRELIKLSGDEILGADSGLRQTMEMVRRVAPMDTPVLLSGETGVGKEVIANAIQQLSSRKGGPFIKINCGAIPETLVDNELFGHEKGAFTGALNQKRGRFERAHNGTIFLDEIGELPPQAQVRLLRVLQHKEIERLGGTRPIFVDIRIIVATHRNLEDMVRRGRFRKDLFFRLNVFPIDIPPLRERKGDLPALTHHFVQKKAREMKLHKPLELAPGAIDHLLAYHWPGNVRELENLVERAIIQNRSGPLSFDHLLSGKGRSKTPDAPPEREGLIPLDDAMALHIRRALNAARGKVEGPRGAAEMLRIKPNTLRNRMKKLGIPYGRKIRPLT